MRRKIVAGNYKMNLNPAEVAELLDGITDYHFIEENKEMKVYPPFIYLSEALSKLGKSPITVGAQNGYFEAKGAFTGEVSMAQLKAFEVESVLVGHSERREIFGEDNSIIKQKVDAALAEGLEVIFCCGEPLEVREAGTQKDFVIQQLEESLFHLSEEALKNVVIAYEPIWAIGTGKTASSAQAEEMHKDIRAALAAKYNAEVAEATSILYGGSVKPDNAAELFACENVDGGLVGGACLKAADFIAIANAL